MPMTAARWGLLALGVALVAGLGGVAFRPAPVAVDLVAVTRGPMRVTVDAEGRTRIREVYAIAAPVGGVLRRIALRPGDRVSAGQTLAEIAPAPAGLLDPRAEAQAEAALAEAEAAEIAAAAELDRARQEEMFARAGWERLRALAERGLAPATELETAGERRALAIAAAAAAEARLTMAASARTRAAAALRPPPAGPDGACCLPIAAPVDGVVLSVGQTSAGPVAAGTPLMSLGDPADLEIVADLLSREALRLPADAPAEVDRWGGPAPLEARLRRIEPQARTVVSALGIDEQRVDAILDLTSPPEQRPGLGDGYAVFVRITEWHSPAALRLPLGAAFRSADGWAVLVAEYGRARLRPVTLGRQDATHFEIRSGLAEGTLVIAHPSDQLEEGSRIVQRRLR